MMNIYRAVKTDVGMKRSNNQDYLGFEDPDDEEGWRQKGSLTIVADGMGGHAGGEVASRIAVDTILHEYLGHPGMDVEPALVQAVHAANQRIFERAQDDPALRGMGTTCTAMVLKDNLAYFAHVGDSRAYLVRDGAIRQVTRDHSLVNQLIDRGDITPEEAETHPDKNVITRSLGIKPNLDVDTVESPHAVRVGDVYLLCSDGLSGLVSSDEMLDAVTRFEPEEAAETLVRLANERGGPDNITVQIVTVLAEGETRPASVARATGRRGMPGGKGKLVLAVAGLLAIGAGTFFVLGRGKDDRRGTPLSAGGAPAATEVLEIHSDPPGAQVLIDGRPTDLRTPARHEAALGVHDVQVLWTTGERSEVRRIDLGLGGLEGPVTFRHGREAAVEGVGHQDEDSGEVAETSRGAPGAVGTEGLADEGSAGGLAVEEAPRASVKLVFIPKAHELYIDGVRESMDGDKINYVVELTLGWHTIEAYNRDLDLSVTKRIELRSPSAQEKLRFRFHKG